MALWLLMQAALWSIHGIKVMFDSQRYLRQADLFAAGELAALKVSYVVYTCMLAFSVWLGSLAWILLFQIALSGIAVMALYQATLHLSQSRLAACLAASLLIIWPDYQFWNFYIHTESLFASGTVLVFWRMVTAERRLHYLQLAFLLLFVTFLRPNGFMVVLAVLVYLGVNWCQHKGYSLWKAGSLLLLLSCTAMVLVAHFFLKDIASDHAFTGHLVSGYIIQGYEPLQIAQDNVIVLEGSPLRQAVAFVWQEPVFFMKKSLMRLLYYWGQVRPHYDLKHNLAIVFLMYPLYLMGMVALLKRQLKAPVVGFVGALALQFSAMVVVSAVDWDNRFIMPLLPFIFLLGAIGFAAVAKKIFPQFLRKGQSILP